MIWNNIVKASNLPSSRNLTTTVYESWNMEIVQLYLPSSRNLTIYDSLWNFALNKHQIGGNLKRGPFQAKQLLKVLRSSASKYDFYHKNVFFFVAFNLYKRNEIKRSLLKVSMHFKNLLQICPGILVNVQQPTSKCIVPIYLFFFISPFRL